MVNAGDRGKNVALIRPPFFTPMSPPLGMAMMKSFVERRGHRVRCIDFNVDAVCWSILRQYFAVLERHDAIGASSGYTTFWSVLNAHLLACFAGADARTCGQIVTEIAARFDIRFVGECAPTLHGLIARLFDRLSVLLDQYDFSDCDLIGTSTYTTSLAPSLFTLKRLKARMPSARTIIGGGVFADDLAIGSSNLDVLCNECDYIDHVVVGEGELPLLALLEGDRGLPRVITLADVGGHTIDLKESVPPDFSNFDLASYSHLSIEGGRSCPFQCSFCSETIQWGTYRKKPSDLLAEHMMQTSSTHGMRRYFMGDSLMNPYINTLSEALLTRQADLLFDGYLRADGPVSELDRVEHWARSGLYRARLGLETASLHVLQIMNKRTTPAKMLAALRALAAQGVRTTTYWVVGHPGETEDDFQETLAFAREAHPLIYELEAHPFYYYPYGQVSSRLYHSEPVYHEWINDIIRFKPWDVMGVSPSRAERFDRLRRFSELTISLGIPNIYTMQELLEAEDRWLRLSPRARRLD
jgi:radical SAM superfamily enzyme YgiQ (UPF0313 family)